MATLLLYYSVYKNIPISDNTQPAPAQPVEQPKQTPKGNAKQPTAGPVQTEQKQAAPTTEQPKETPKKGNAKQPTAKQAAPQGEQNNKKKQQKKKIQLKTPKGTRDYTPVQMGIREQVFNTIITVFKRYGAVTIETPLFELKETLTNKYGEDSKLIYDLQDQGGEICSLRYDLTVPFARHLAMNRITAMKRYHIGRVYRRDQPSAHQGRWREFYQCDFDIAGIAAEPMLPDAEILCALNDILSALNIGKFLIKINSRKLLDGIFAISQVPEDKFRSICSSVDKLDKLSWEEVKKEMLAKGIDNETAERINSFVKLSGKPKELLQDIVERGVCAGNKRAEEGLNDLRLLFDYLEIFGALDNISFDLSLARGLDYYTGIIYEAVILDQGGLGVGSIAGGGRYDGLVSDFGGGDIPCIGFSVGVERIFAILEAKEKDAAFKTRPSATEVLVCSISDTKNAVTLMKQRMKIASDFRKAGIPAEFIHKKNPRIADQLKYASEMQIPFAVIFGEEEFNQNIVKIKDLIQRTEEVVSGDNLVAHFKKLLGNKN